MLSATGLHVGYGDAPVLWDVNLTVGDGELVAMVGPNGAGKTTLVNALARLLPVREGQIMLSGHDATRITAQEMCGHGVAIIPEDTPYRDRMVKAARKTAGRTITFGHGEADVTALHAVRADNGGSLVTAQLLDSELTYTIAQRGDHWVMNSLAVLAAIEAAGADLAIAGLALADMGGLKGRGERHRLRADGGHYLLIDESYKANPA